MNIQNLKGIIPDSVLEEIPSVIEKFDVNTTTRLAHFLAQCGHESLDFTKTTESLYYKNPLQICKIFRRFDLDKDRVIDDVEIEFAKGFLKNSEKLANYVYSNRMGNGDIASGDGFKRRGAGYIQLTGADNQKAFFISIGLPADSDPKLIATKYPLLSAAWFWKTNNLNKISDAESVKKVTSIVNGGTHGLVDRENRFKKYLKALIE